MIKYDLERIDVMRKKMMKQNKGWTVVFYVLYLILMASSGYMLYSLSLLSNIENTLRLIGAIAIIIIAGLFILLSARSVIKQKKTSRIILAIILILYSGALFFIASNVHVVIDKIGNVSTNSTTYSSSIVTMKKNKAESISDIGSSELGMIKDENSIDGYQIPKQIIKNKKLSSNKIVEYDDYVSMLNDLYEGKIDYIFLPTGYTIKFGSLEGFEEIGNETKILYTEEKEIKTKTTKRGNKIDKPFTILLMGVDSEQENIKGASFNGDSLMLLTFNPTTLNTTILSIPRDTYVPISCFAGNRKNKITHAAWQGEDCMIKTIQDFTGITIDYYAKINFKGVVKLVDALGGIDVDVPIDFCEQDSNRDFANLICLKTGPQTLNGEQALALSRHRKTINDFVRGQNQQLVVKGLMNKAKTIKSIDTIYKLLDTLSNNLETNMTTNEILSFYNVAKDLLSRSKENTSVEELFGMQRLYISGIDATIHDYNSIVNQGTRLNLYNFVPYESSIKDVVTAMKINLGLEKPKIIKTFQFDIDEPYEETVIGKGNYKDANLNLLPNFVGYDKSKAISYGNQNGLKVNINYVDSSQREGQIISQNLTPGMDLTAISKSTGLTLTVSNGKGGSSSIKDNNKDDKDKTDNKNNPTTEEKLPNFVGGSYNGSIITNFRSNHKNIIIALVKISEGEAGFDIQKKGQIISQDVKAGTSLSGLEGKTITLKYIDPLATEPEEPDDGGEEEELPPEINPGA